MTSITNRCAPVWVKEYVWLYMSKWVRLCVCVCVCMCSCACTAVNAQYEWGSGCVRARVCAHAWAHYHKNRNTSLEHNQPKPPRSLPPQQQHPHINMSPHIHIQSLTAHCGKQQRSLNFSGELQLLLLTLPQNIQLWPNNKETGHWPSLNKTTRWRLLEAPCIGSPPYTYFKKHFSIF